MTRSYQFCLGLGTLLVVSATACARPSSSVTLARSEPTAGAAPKRLVGGLIGDVWTLSSAVSTAGGGGTRGVPDMEMLIHAGLTDPDPKAQGPINPQLAEATPSLENGLWKILPDGWMEITWRIRTDARWHDGTPVTSDDMVFTAQVGTDRTQPMRQHAGFAVVESVEALDSHTVLTRWRAPFIEANWMFSYPFALPLPRHLLGRTFEETPESLTEAPYWTSEFVGTGPFRLREFVRGSHLVLEANRDYVLGRPKVDRLEIRFLADGNAFLANLLAGEVEITIGPEMTLDQLVQLRDGWPTGRVLFGPNDASTMIFPQFIDPRPAIIANVEFRRALLHAMDRQEIIDNLLYGLPALAQVSVANPRQPDYVEIDQSITHYEFDPRKAAQLIEQLGYSRGADGAFLDSAGQPLALEVRGTEGKNTQMALAVTDYWHRIGLTAQTVTIPRARVNDREYLATRPGFQISNASSQSKGFEALHSRQVPVQANDWVGNNRARYASQQLDALLDRYFVTIPLRERSQVLAQIARQVSEQVVTMGLHYEVDPTAASNRVQNVRHGEPHNSREWELVD